jgi:hypothetical protein
MGHSLGRTIGCESFRSQVFDSFYLFLDQNKVSPNEEALLKSAMDVLDQRLSSVSMAEADQTDFRESYRSILRVLSHSEASSDLLVADQTRWLISLETGSIESSDLQKHGKLLQRSLDRFKILIEKYGITQDSSNQCPPPESREASEATQQKIDQKTEQTGLVQPSVTDPQEQGSVWPEPGSDVIPFETTNHHTALSRMTIGARWTFANIYQSCEILQLPDLSVQTPELQGVAKDNKVDQVGWGRKYTSIPLLQKTHFYLNFGPESREFSRELPTACRSVRNAPPVYDYGGVPHWDGLNTLNFFANSGTGGPALGVDCSAFVSSAIAQAGLRYSPGLPNKPIYSRRNSSDFLHPEASGLSCFDRIEVNSSHSLQVGDIMAIQGHVVLIDRVSVDPFGISQVTKKEDCKNLRWDNFDFTILQSSPSKNSIGVNRFGIHDYLSEGAPAMERGFLKYAVAACLSRFDGKTRKLMDTEVSIIRHKGTPECLSNKRVQFTGDDCVRSCHFE